MDPPKVPLPLPQLGLADQLLAVSDDEKTELDKVLQLLLDPANIAHNTELTRNEILAFSVLATLAKRHELPVLRDFLAENLVLRVSKGRAGRKEWVKIVSRQLEQNAQEEVMQGSRWGRFLAGRNKR